MFQNFSNIDLIHVHDQLGVDWEVLRGKRIFFTGGTGFVGKWLLATLLYANFERALNCEIVLLSRDPDRFRKKFPTLAMAPGVKLFAGDVRSFELPPMPFDMVIHGALDVASSGGAVETMDTCYKGTRRVLDFAGQCGARDFLLLSSGAVYGRQPPGLERLTESWFGAPDPLAPNSAYGSGKRVAECLSVHYGRAINMRVKIARCFAFIGAYLPLDKHFAIGNFIRDALRGNDIIIHGDGTPVRSYLYAADLAAWLWTIALRGKDGMAYNVGGDEMLSIADLAHAVNTALRTNVAVIRALSPAADVLPERYVPDISKAMTELGLKPLVSLPDAIERTACWARVELSV